MKRQQPAAPASFFVCCVVVITSACPAAPAGQFGAVCTGVDDCDGLQCRVVDGGRRCVPPRAPGEAGESCADPLKATEGEGDVVVDEVVFFGGAVDDGDVCGSLGRPDVSLRFSLPVDSGLVITVDDPGVVVGLRPVCGEVVRAGCATAATPALLSAVPAGEWELVLDGDARDVGAPDEAGVHVVVSRIDCPLGYLPLDAAQCVGFRAMQPLLRARGAAGIGVVGDGDAIVLGGVGRDGEARVDGELFSGRTESFSFVDAVDPHVAPVVVDVGGSIFVLGGNVPGDSVVDIIDRPNNPAPPITVATAVYDVVLLGAEPVLLTDAGFLTLRFDVARRSCTSNAQCLPGIEQCSVGVCACVGLDCVERRTARAELTDGVFQPGTRGMATGPDAFVILGAAPGVGFRVFQQTVTRAFSEGRTIPATPRRDAALVSVGRFVYAFGGRTVEPGEASSSSLVIERVDALAEEAVVVGALPVALDAPRAVTLQDRWVALFQEGDEVRLFDTQTSTFVTLPPLPSSRRQVGFVGHAGGALLAGGFDDDDAPIADVQRLEIVPRTAPAPVPAPPHCNARALALDGTAVVGSTGGARDRFRDGLCFFNRGSGDEHWQIELDAPRSVQLIATPTDGDVTGLRISVSEALCAEGSPVVACDVDALFIPELPAGTWFISVESVFPFNDDPEIADGRSYTIEARDLAPEACVGDDADPADDVVVGAVELPRTDFGGIERDGALCPGDVDHLLVQQLGGQGELFVGGFVNDVLIAPAFIDVAASAGADRLIVDDVGAFEPLRTFAGGLGYYVVQLGPLDGLRGRLEWTVSWAPECTPDDRDSLITAFDDGTDVARAPRLGSGQTINRALCHQGDRDIVVFEPDRLGTMFIGIDDVDVDFAFFAFDPVLGVLGAPLDPVLTEDFTSRLAVLSPSLEPFALLLTVGDVGPRDHVSVDFDIAPPGDTCDSAEPLPGDAGTLGGSSLDFRNDHDASNLGDCTGFRSPGEDRVLSLSLATGETLDATVTPRGNFDVAVYLLSACPLDPFDPVCLVGDDQAGRGDSDDIRFTNTGAAADFFLVVDSFFGESYEYDLTWSIE